MYSVKIVCRHRVVGRGGGMGVCIKRSTMQARFFALILQFGLEKVLVARRLATENRRPSEGPDRGHHRRGRREGSQAPDSEAEATEPDSLNKKKKRTRILRHRSLICIGFHGKWGSKFSNSRAKATGYAATSAVASFSYISRKTSFSCHSLA